MPLLCYCLGASEDQSDRNLGMLGAPTRKIVIDGLRTEGGKSGAQWSIRQSHLLVAHSPF